MPKPKKSVKKNIKPKVLTKVLTKEEMQKYESQCNDQVLCLSDSDYDVQTEEVDVNEQTFFKHLENGFTNYDSDNDDEIVREYNDTESLDSMTSSTSMSRVLKYDSDNEEDDKKTKSTKKAGKTRPKVNTK